METKLDCRLFCKNLISFILTYLFFVIPTVAESVIIGISQDADIAQYTIITSSIIIHIILFYGGFMLIKKNRDYIDKGLDSCTKIWCGSIHNPKYFFGPAYIIYSMPLWVICNAVCTWKWGNWYIYLVSHTVIVSYILGLCIGHIYDISLVTTKEEIKPLINPTTT